MFESRSSNKRARKISQDSLVFEGPILPKSFVNHLRQYLGKSFGLGLITIGTLIILSLISYHPSDPSLNSASGGAVKNIIGIFGSYSSDLLLQLFGSIAILPSILFYAWGWRLLAGKSLGFFWLRSLVAFFTLLLASMTVSQISTPEDWSLHTGLGGTCQKGPYKIKVILDVYESFPPQSLLKVIRNDQVLSKLPVFVEVTREKGHIQQIEMIESDKKILILSKDKDLYKGVLDLSVPVPLDGHHCEIPDHFLRTK